MEQNDCNAKLVQGISDLNLSLQVAENICRNFPIASPKEKSRLLQLAKNDAKKIFKDDCAEILKTLPKAMTNRFNRLGFASWGKVKTYNPVLVVNPFQIPPSEARSSWLKKYYKVRQRNP
jgi:hypothetical protein